MVLAILGQEFMQSIVISKVTGSNITLIDFQKGFFKRNVNEQINTLPLDPGSKSRRHKTRAVTSSSCFAYNQ